VERAIGRRPDPPVGFEDLLARPERMVRIGLDASELDRLIR
jgi:hypothetical protein